MKGDNNYIQQLKIAEPLSEHECINFEKQLGFLYRKGIGEIIYALVTYRPGISFAAIKLSQYLANPAKIHYRALKDIYQYLEATENEGIYFLCKEPRIDLLVGPTPICKNDSNYDETTIIQRQQNYALQYYTEQHTNKQLHTQAQKQNLLQHVMQVSIFFIFIFAVYWKKLVCTRKMPQYCMKIIREHCLTRHMDLKYFGLQEWVQGDLLILHRINTADNYADAMTKALGQTLFYHHVNFIMDKIIPPYNMMDLVVRRLYDRHVSIYDKNLGFLSREGVTPRCISQSDRDM